MPQFKDFQNGTVTRMGRLLNDTLLLTVHVEKMKCVGSDQNLFYCISTKI